MPVNLVHCAGLAVWCQLHRWKRRQREAFPHGEILLALDIDDLMANKHAVVGDQNVGAWRHLDHDAGGREQPRGGMNNAKCETCTAMAPLYPATSVRTMTANGSLPPLLATKKYSCGVSGSSGTRSSRSTA